MRARPALSTERENYILGEMDFVNKQLESEYQAWVVKSLLNQRVSLFSTNIAKILSQDTRRVP